MEQADARWCTTVFAVISLGLGGLAAVAPGVLAGRFRPIDAVELDAASHAAHRVVQALAVPWILAGLVGLAASLRRLERSPALGWVATGAAVVAYLSLQAIFWDWIVDDAAITFAYSENLVRGHGLVLHPSHPPQEAYSNPLWMLVLAFARWVGFEIDAAAKLACVVCGALCVALTMRACAAVSSPTDYGPMLLCAIVALGAPFVVWSCSGLEHALQALLFVTLATLPMLVRRPVVPSAICLGLLVLLRPEAPLIVAATAAVYALERRSQGRAALLRLWPLVAVPAACGAALLAFRLSYFGVPFPNPYYAKASSATMLRALNFLGGGWGYVLDWLAQSGAYALVPLLVLGATARLGTTVRLAIALATAQLVFVFYAGGDWMGCFRFVAPLLPLLALVVAAMLRELGTRLPRARIELGTLVLAWLLGIGTTVGLQRFRASPTTPAAEVAAIGSEFVALADRLGIEQPSLAHHDAGGTSWAAGIDLVDLGGLGDRAIAQHMHDPEFMRRYLFVERRPTFVFGSTTTFAAGATAFHLMPEFAEQYVPVEFPGRPYMRSGLCHMRRDAVRDAPGITRVWDDDRLVAVVVSDMGMPT